MSKGPDPVEVLINNVADEVAQMIFNAPNSSGSTRLPNQRQILVVEKAAVHSAGYVRSNASPTPQSQLYIRLDGRPTSNSDITYGYIRFVPSSKLRPPKYEPARTRLDVFIDEKYLPAVLDQLDHAKRYFWIGYFDGGHVYADLHSER